MRPRVLLMLAGALALAAAAAADPYLDQVVEYQIGTGGGAGVDALPGVVLGAPVGFAEVISFEAGLSLLRNFAFFAPAGLGVQDLGYLAFLNALGFPGAGEIGAAFVLMKRAKELFWIAIGYTLFLVARKRAPLPPAEQAAHAQAVR